MDSSVHGRKMRANLINPPPPQLSKIPAIRSPSAPCSTPLASASNSVCNLYDNHDLFVSQVINQSKGFSNHLETITSTGFKGCKFSHIREVICTDAQNSGTIPEATKNFHPNVKKVSVSPTRRKRADVDKHGLTLKSSIPRNKAEAQRILPATFFNILPRSIAVGGPIQTTTNKHKQSDRINTMRSVTYETSTRHFNTENVKKMCNNDSKLLNNESSAHSNMHMLNDLLPQYKCKSVKVRIGDIVSTLDMIIHPTSPEDFLNHRATFTRNNRKALKYIDLKVWK